MCGIFGFLLNRPLAGADLERGRRATARLRHRGPDGSGEWMDLERGAYLGHTRLAILDRSEANAQPLSRAGLTLTYNGEIYNFVELREELEAAGHGVTTSGDTEVLFTAWREWGPAALDRFDGMYAFALYDGVRLHLVTDPFGEKPVFWAKTAEGVYFASEAQVLIELLALGFAPSQQEVTSFLALGYLPAPATGYPGMEALPPATHLTLDAGGVVAQRRYWCPPAPQRCGGPVRPLSEAELDRIHEVLTGSLARRLRADVPLGLFLSSGVDSTLVAAILAKDLRADVTAYTVSFPDGADESAIASGIARRLGLHHRVIDSRENEDWRDAPGQLAALYATPNDNLTVMAVRQMSELARSRMTVALSGLGGDEIFFGYQKYVFLYRKRRHYRLLAPIVNLAAPFDGALRRLRAWRTASQLLRGCDGWRYLALKNSGMRELLEQLPGVEAWACGLLTDGGTDLAFRVRDFDLHNTLPGSIIPPIDRGSMRAGLEVRTPYLSRDLIETVARLDPRSFLAHGQKEPLRRLLDRYLPREALYAGKQGFVFPETRYLKTCPDQAPEAPLAPEGFREQAWRNRVRPEYGRLAIRIALLARLSVPQGAGETVSRKSP